MTHLYKIAISIAFIGGAWLGFMRAGLGAAALWGVCVALFVLFVFGDRG
ncbi:MAG: hypothetical protein HC888_05275 [Candidatus Competibacteraceae bacterium]|nr:hypothetical protein [Candidatus Competibacteraceae bacterium]